MEEVRKNEGTVEGNLGIFLMDDPEFPNDTSAVVRESIGNTLEHSEPINIYALRIEGVLNKLLPKVRLSQDLLSSLGREYETDKSRIQRSKTWENMTAIIEHAITLMNKSVSSEHKFPQINTDLYRDITVQIIGDLIEQ